MTTQNSYGSDWTMNDVHRYVEKDMTSEEVRQFEAALERDPFLKDAVDGYAGHARIYIDHHLERLNSEFQPAGTRRALPIWGLATAATLVLAVTAWFIIQRGGVGNNVVADNQKLEQTEPPSQLSEDLLSSEKTESMMKGAESDFAEGVLDTLNIDDALIAAQQPETVKAPIKRRPRPAKKQAPGGIVSGTVIDSDGQPLIGANVFFPNNDAAITTDFNGNFAVELKGHDSMAIVKHTGYESGAFRIEPNNKQEFQLTQGLALEELQVAALEVESDQQRNSRKESNQIEPASSDFALDGVPSDNLSDQQISIANPERGFKKYERYIKRNLKYPSSARVAKIEGEVVLQFKVLPNGDLFDFRILQGVGSGCDEEAIRLIREGPAWKTEPADKIGQVNYSINFKIK